VAERFCFSFFQNSCMIITEMGTLITYLFI
jgi:hypothetical protein